MSAQGDNVRCQEAISKCLAEIRRARSDGNQALLRAKESEYERLATAHSDALGRLAAERGPRLRNAYEEDNDPWSGIPKEGR